MTDSVPYDPASYGPGKVVTPQMAEAFFHANAHKIVMMLMLRLKQTTINIVDTDVNALLELPKGTSLVTKHVPEGLTLFIAGPGVSSSLGETPK